MAKPGRVVGLPVGIPGEHTVLVTDNAEPAGSQPPDRGEPAPARAKRKPWRPWTLAVAAPVALFVSLLLLLGDLLEGVLSNLGGPTPIATFLDIAVAGHAVLALTSAALFGVGIANAARRRPVVLAEWAIIPVGVGWFYLWGRLAAG